VAVPLGGFVARSLQVGDQLEVRDVERPRRTYPTVLVAPPSPTATTVRSSPPSTMFHWLTQSTALIN
jgi:hypothetical protein